MKITFIKCRQVIRKEGTKTWKNSGNEIPTEKLPVEERWSARYFSLDKVLKPVIIEESNVKKVDWFHSICNWENYINFFASSEAKMIQRPHEGLIKYHEWNGIGVDNDNEE